jgi:hypothetical protein
MSWHNTGGYGRYNAVSPVSSMGIGFWFFSLKQEKTEEGAQRWTVQGASRSYGEGPG